MNKNRVNEIWRQKMKKEKIRFWLLALCMITIFVGCSSNTSKKDTDIQEENTPDLIEAQEEKLDLEKYSLEYNMQTDAQPFFQGSGVTESEYGYYFWEEMGALGRGRMMFYDAESGQCVPLCNRPDCSHNSTECNAYFNASGGTGDYFARDCLQYYDGSIYIIGYDAEYYVNLYKIAADGSSWETYMQLYRADMSSPSGDNSTDWVIPSYCVHRDYVYYIDNKESVPKIRRMKLGSSETEVVYESAGERAQLYRMEAYGDYLFFQTGNYVDEDYEELKAGIAAYNIQTGEICMVKCDTANAYIIQKDSIYYRTNEEIRSFSLLTQEDKLVLDTGTEFTNFSLDEQYIYTYELWNRIMEIYDYEGNLVCKFENDNIWSCYFGNTEYLFASAFKGQETYKVILDISKIAEGNAEWERIY